MTKRSWSRFGFRSLVVAIIFFLISRDSSFAVADIDKKVIDDVKGIQFSFCTPLNNAVFDIKPDEEEDFVKTIDGKAKEIYNVAYDLESSLNQESLLRLSCFTPTLQNAKVDYVNNLSSISLPTSYFPFLPFHNSSLKVKLLKESFNCTKKFKIAYVFIVHHDFENIIVLFHIFIIGALSNVV
jgi:hypothetical protein